ncbi:MAG: AtpZ/AtpI family protein [Elainellaceae cyanobacterium]
MPKSNSLPDSPNAKQATAKQSFINDIGEKARRKLKARRTRRDVWYGLGLFGMVGWSVAIPAILGIALGAWIDRRVNSQYSWTLMLLALGMLLGCWNAWYWVTKENQRHGD